MDLDLRRPDYREFLAAKTRRVMHDAIPEVAFDPSGLFPHQDALGRWACRMGRCAVFADTGLGKTRIQLRWAEAVHRSTGHDVLILAPLAVAEQTVREGAEIGVPVRHVRESDDVQSGISITNYERLHKMDADRFGSVVLDESSCIKNHDSKTLRALMDAFRDTPFRLCATATPAPNDWTELGTHAEFLGVMTNAEMRATFFVHDGGSTQNWRLKGHAVDPFWRWVASWGAMVRSPSDLGFAADGYDLPPLDLMQITVDVDPEPEDGFLFPSQSLGLVERRTARRVSIDARASVCAEMVNASDEPWIVWCELNAEGDALRRAIPDAMEVRGSDPIDVKESRLRAFADGQLRVLITKPSIAGFGLNWQHCARVAFVGVSDSWESYYQAVRRCWRFGQKREVQVRLFASSEEGDVVRNLMRKEHAANEMFARLRGKTQQALRESVLQDARPRAIESEVTIEVPSWLKT